jgi:hypothetical protein
MDKNRDGTITPEEIAHAVETMKINMNDIQMAELLNRMDYDGDGTFVVLWFSFLCSSLAAASTTRSCARGAVCSPRHTAKHPHEAVATVC